MHRRLRRSTCRTYQSPSRKERKWKNKHPKSSAQVQPCQSGALQWTEGVSTKTIPRVRGQSHSRGAKVFIGPRGQKRVIRDRSAPRRSVWRVGQERLCGTVCCRATARHPDPIPQPQGNLSTSYPAPRCHRQTRRYSLWTRGRSSLEASRCSYQSRDRHR